MLTDLLPALLNAIPRLDNLHTPDALFTTAVQPGPNPTII